MKKFLMLLMLFGAYTAQAQKIQFNIDGQADTTVHLVKYFGKNLFYADTAEIKNGTVTFDGSNQKAGILALYIPGQNILEFVYNKEDNILIEAHGPNFMSNAVAKKSEENKIFFKYVQYIADQKAASGRFDEQRKKHDVDSEPYKKLTDQMDAITEKVEAYQKNLVEQNSDKLVGKIVNMSMDVEIPEPPKDEKGNLIDSNFRFNYFKNHFWDNIDLNDDRLVRTPVFDNKLKHYFGKKMLIQHWDTMIVYSYDLIDRLDPSSDMFQYVVSNLTSKFEKSKVMGMNKAFIYLGLRYYCSDGQDIEVAGNVYPPVRTKDGGTPAHWMPDDKLETLCEKVNTHRNLVMGETPPNIKLKDSTDVNWHDFMSLDSDYTVLYFWDPDCGHCKKITPKLQTLYSKKWKDRNVEIFAVAKAAGEDFEKWKKFIRKHNLEFINVGVTKTMYDDATNQENNQISLKKLLEKTTLESLNYQKAYDIFATPKVWVLNKDKEIIAYSLTVSQLEDMIDRLQDKQDADKLFPPEEDIEDEQMH